MIPLSPTLMLVSWHWCHYAPWSLAPLARLLPRDARTMALNVWMLTYAFWAVCRWHELNYMPRIVMVPHA